MPITGQQFADRIEQVQQRILELIKTETGNAARYHNRYTIDTNNTAWLGLLTNSTGKTYSHQVEFAGFREPDSEATRTYEPTVLFNIWSFLIYEVGTTAANSEKAFRLDMARLTLLFRVKYNLDFTNDLSPIHRCYGYYPTISINPIRALSGDTTGYLHIGRGTLTVDFRGLDLF